MTPEILFVDDEPDVLRGLKRTLRHKRREWNIRFAEGGEQALAFVREKAANIIVTDMRMPEIDGANLLERIVEDNPFCCRFVLSGQADSDSVRRVVGISHQFLAKPFDSAKLIDIIENQLEIIEIEQSSRILALASLPSPEKIANRVRLLLKDPEGNREELAELIGDDLALSAKMLQLSNSAYFGTGHVTILPGDAVRTIGPNLLRTLISDPGFVETFSKSDAQHVTVVKLLETSGILARRADAIARALPNVISDPILFRQLCKFMPLGRLLGFLTGSNSKFDRQLCLAFVNLWGFPAQLIDILSIFWSKDNTRDDVNIARAMADVYADLLLIPNQLNPDELLCIAKIKGVL
jgi:CheY-like chemotaxis protein